jgi:hypothetical protein
MPWPAPAPAPLRQIYLHKTSPLAYMRDVASRVAQAPVGRFRGVLLLFIVVVACSRNARIHRRCEAAPLSFTFFSLFSMADSRQATKKFFRLWHKKEKEKEKQNGGNASVTHRHSYVPRPNAY